MLTRFRPGQVRDTVVDCLTRSGDHGATIAEIRDHFQRISSSPPPESSIRSSLRLNTPELFERISPGRYRLVTSHVTPEAALAEPVYRYGRSQLFQGDAIEWLKAQPRESIHGVVTDPPYGLVEYSEEEQAKLRRRRGGNWRIPPSFDGHARSPLPRFTTLNDEDLRSIETFFSRLGGALLPVLLPGAHVLMAANPLVSHLISYSLDRAGFERRGEVVRLVTTMRGGDRPKNAHAEFPDVSVMPRSMWEPWLLFRKPFEGTVASNLRRHGTGGLRRISGQQPFGDVIRSSPTQSRERAIANHPSLKPQAFLRQVVRAILPTGEGIVLDPFAGSGSTLAAAEAVGYQSMGVELDPVYVDLAKQSIARLAHLPDKGLTVEVDPGVSEFRDSVAI